MENLFFVEVKCVNTGKIFYMRYDYAADDRWARTRGVPFIPEGKSLGGGLSSVDISNARIGPQYKCPYCGNKGAVRHDGCGKITCKKSGESHCRCAYCNVDLKVTGSLTAYSNVTMGHGQA